MPVKNILIVATVALTALGLLYLPVPANTPSNVLPTLALSVFTIGLWATGALPEHVTAAIFLCAALGLSIAPPEIIFSGLTSSAFWMVVGGIIIGAAAGHTGLGRYLAHFFTRRPGSSYFRLIAGIVVGCVALAFLLPSSMGRLIILMPIVLGLADNMGLAPDSRGRTGMAAACALGTFYVPLTILPANLPNVVLAGAADTLYGIAINYGEYMLLNFPITGVLKGVFLVIFVTVLFNSEIPNAGQPTERLELGSDGKRQAVILSFALLGWATDFIHGISPSWISITAGLVCLLPGVGVLPMKKLKGSSSHKTLLYVIAILGVGAVISKSGAGSFIAGEVLKVLEFQQNDPAGTYVSFSGLGMFFSIFSTLPGMIAILTPFAERVADSSGQPLFIILMMIVNGFTTIFLPYQSAPIMVGLRLGGVSLPTAARVMFPLGILTLLLLQPLNYFWWRWLGYLN